MRGSRRRAMLVLVALAVGASAAAVVGHAASLGVDAARLDAFAASQAAPTTIVPTDTTAPGLTALQMFDINANGKVDRVVATFDEVLQGSTSSSGWTLSGTVPSGGSLASVSAAAGTNQATLTLAEGGGAADTAVGTFRVSLAGTTSDIRDAAGNRSSFPATAPTDKAHPLAMKAEYFDANTNAKIDQIRVTYSESLASTTATTPWSITGGASIGLESGDLAANTASTTDAVITLPFTENSGTPTATTTVAPSALTVILDNSSAAVKDLATPPNAAANLSRAATDRANPIPLSLNIPNGPGIDNKATQGDTVVVVWSERLLASTICATGFSDTTTQTYDANDANAQIKVINGATSDRVEAAFDCGSFRFGTLTLGSTLYTTADRTFAANGNADRSKATWAPSTATFTLTLGKLVGTDVLGTVNAPAPPAQPPTAAYTPDPGLTDPSGNAPTGTATKTDAHF